MKKTARILTVVFTVVALFGSTLTAQAATVKSNKKVKYYKTASAKKKAGTFKKATKLTAISMAKGFVKFKKGSKNLYIKVADVKISGKYTAKVSKKTKVYNKKLKATKTVLKKNKSLTISGMKVKKKVAYLKYAAGKFVKATDVKVTSFAATPAPTVAPVDPTVAPVEPTVAPTVAPTEAPVVPTEAPVDPTVAPTEAPVDPNEGILGPNLIPAEKASFDYWANGAHQGEGLSSSDFSGNGYSVADGYGKLADGDPRPNNYTYNLNADTGATYGHWNFGGGYGNDSVNNIQGLTKGVTYEISFEYYAPFENDFVVQNLYNTADKETQTNLLPGGTQQILVATDEWQTFTVRAEFNGIFLMNFGMWNPMADTEVGVFIDNFSIRAVLETLKPVVTAAPEQADEGLDLLDGYGTKFKKVLTASDKDFSPNKFAQSSWDDNVNALAVAGAQFNSYAFLPSQTSGFFTPGSKTTVRLLVKTVDGCQYDIQTYAHDDNTDHSAESANAIKVNKKAVGSGDWEVIEIEYDIPESTPDYEYNGLVIQFRPGNWNDANVQWYVKAMTID